MIGYALLVGTPSIQAVALAQLYEALEKAGNVCITGLLPGAAEPWPRPYKTLVASHPTDQEIQKLVQTLFPEVQRNATTPRPRSD